jgi:hypothetical protein
MAISSPNNAGNRAKLRALSLLARLPIAAWLGIAGVGVQAALPLFLAFAIASVDRTDGTAGSHSAIHQHHADHAPGPQHKPGDHHQHQHPGCILCQGLQAASPFTLPMAAVFALPSGETAVDASAAPSAALIRRPTAAYASRAPPSIG